MRVEHIGDCTLYLGDCVDVLPTLGKVDAVVTDPPYGIGAGRMSFGKWRTASMDKGSWDDDTPDLSMILDMNVPTIVFGGNYFVLPPSRGILVWNKGAGFKGRDFAECEIAWSNIDANAREFTFDPLARGSYREKKHPTQKPVEVMAWCISRLPGQPKVVCDPFMGSGTTGVACVKRGGVSFIGVEKHEPYFDIACRRIEAAYKQPDMFVERPPPPKQEALL